MGRSVDEKWRLIEPDYSQLSLTRQCHLLGLSRGSLYYQPRGESDENLYLMRLLDEQYTRTPFYGVCKMTAWLRSEGYPVNEKRIRRLMRLMGLEAIYQRLKVSEPAPGHRIYPYLLRGVTVLKQNHVWSTDITYIRMLHGFIYLVAIIDWSSRYVVSWEISVTLDSEFCLSALDRALAFGSLEIFNSDQGS